MTDGQLQWVNTMKNAASAKPARAARMPSNPCRGCAFRLVTSSPFDNFIMTVIILNVGVMACDYWGIEQVLATH